MIEHYIMTGIGSCRYVVNYWQGKYHDDGSKFYDIRIFSNKKKMHAFIKSLALD